MSTLQKPIVWGKALEKVLLRDRVIGDLEGSLVCLLPFEEGFGVRVRDYSLFENHGTISGASWIDGKYGKALSFNGVDNYVSVPHDPSLNFGTGDFTLEAWVKLPSFIPHPLAIIIKTFDWTNAYSLFFDHGPYRFGILAYDDILAPIAYTTTTLTAGQWYHVVGTKVGDTMNIYLDGVFEGDDFRGALGSLDNDGDLIIGADIVLDDDYFNGLIDEVRIYNRALSAEEIKRRFEERRSVYGI